MNVSVVSVSDKIWWFRDQSVAYKVLRFCENEPEVSLYDKKNFYKRIKNGRGVESAFGNVLTGIRDFEYFGNSFQGASEARTVHATVLR